MIFLALSKLDITPAKSRGFTPTHPCAQESEKEQLKISIYGFEKQLRLFARQRDRLELLRIRWKKPPHLVSRVPLEKAIFYCTIQDHTQYDQSVLKRVGRQTFRREAREELFHVVATDLIYGSILEAWPHVESKYSSIATDRRRFAVQLGMLLQPTIGVLAKIDLLRLL